MAPTIPGETMLLTSHVAEMKSQPEAHIFTVGEGDESDEKVLSEILEPLIDLLNERYEKCESHDPFVIIEITGGQMYSVASPYPNCEIIELPSGLRDYPSLASVVATLVQRSGSDTHWLDDADGEDDPYRTSLRFCMVTKVIWMPSDNCFSEGVHLMVDSIKFDSRAAEKQVALLVEYLKDDANLVKLSANDLLMF